jgi:lipopolysaccharide export system protein LptC
MAEGEATVSAARGVYNLEDETLFVDGPVIVRREDGYRLETADVLVDMPTRMVRGQGRIEGAVPLGTFSGDRLQADLERRTVVLEGDVRMRVVPGSQRRDR